MSIWVKICKYVDFRQTFPNISILVKILKNIYQFSKKSILVKFVEKSRFWSKLTELSILDKIKKNVDYSQFFLKMWIWVKICKYLYLGQIVEKFRFWSIFMKISILVKIYENLDFGKNCRKILILVNILGKSRFLSISLVK